MLRYHSSSGGSGSGRKDLLSSWLRLRLRITSCSWWETSWIVRKWEDWHAILPGSCESEVLFLFIRDVSKFYKQFSVNLSWECLEQFGMKEVDR